MIIMIEVGGTIRMTWKSKVCLWFYRRFLVFQSIGQWFLNHVDMEEKEQWLHPVNE